MNDVQKRAVSVSEMARMVGMSRARFYQLLDNGVFPKPLYEESTRRPYFDEVLQDQCLEVRRRNYGINGKPVLFYPARVASPIAKQSKKMVGKPKTDFRPMIESLRALGLNTTTLQFEEAIKSNFPNGTDGVDEGALIRSLFLSINRQQSSR